MAALPIRVIHSDYLMCSAMFISLPSQCVHYTHWVGLTQTARGDLSWDCICYSRTMCLTNG